MPRGHNDPLQKAKSSTLMITTNAGIIAAMCRMDTRLHSFVLGVVLVRLPTCPSENVSQTLIIIIYYIIVILRQTYGRMDVA